MTQPHDERVKVFSVPSPNEAANREKFYELYKNNPIPPAEQLLNLGLFINRQNMSRMLFMHDLYRQILPVHGVVMEFGCRWGQNLAMFTSFRGMYEPFNHNRRIVGFDTFSGFPGVTAQDGTSAAAKAGNYAVTQGYEAYLDQVLAYHETESPVGHIKKYEIIKGDATKTVEKYLEEHPETIIALAYFDFDIYAPTKRCLELIRDRLTKGSVVGFDELNHPPFPGETVAVREVLGLSKYSIRRSACNPMPSYIVVE